MSRRENANADADQLHQFVYDHLVALWRDAELAGRTLNVPTGPAEEIVTSAVGQFFVDRLYGQGVELRDARHQVEDFWDIAEGADEERAGGGAREPRERERGPEERERE